MPVYFLLLFVLYNVYNLYSSTVITDFHLSGQSAAQIVIKTGYRGLKIKLWVFFNTFKSTLAGTRNSN
ncbi:MAG: hypothetical protein CENE_00192 [Candidatus Celerinatantimonas neptuna]|nr:MAG: hypothetical protein CENE_00192 [Candidatus Celerinatantimonas neptuna]